MIFTKSTHLHQPISRKSLAWLLVVQVFILAPHFIIAPWWIALMWITVAFWRWKNFQGAWNYPTKVKKTILVAVCCAGLLLSLGSSFRFESMVSLLLVGFSLKLLELKNKKDFVLLIFIAFFILATQFIELTNIAVVFYGFACLTLLCATLMQLHVNNYYPVWKSLRSSLWILLQAIPFMVLLFVVIPRIGSFWAVPTPQHAKTGMSSSMTPGSFTELMESKEVAFRVVFSGAMPRREKLYWRSLVFSFFDGRRWTQNAVQKTGNYTHQNNKTLSSHIMYNADRVDYDVIAEPSAKPWLYTLAAPEHWSNTLVFARDMRLQTTYPVIERMNYHVTSALTYQLNEIDGDELTQNLQLPTSGNPITRTRARQWLIEAGSTEKLINKLFNYYHQSFIYTLRPPRLGDDTVDDFLWNSKQGFCEYFASSFVFFMRAAGVPARVVVGYQGGDISPIDNSLTVRQRDAHAWAEVWLAGRGWVRFDPTAAVAPERIQKGISDSLSNTDQQFLAKPFGSSLKILLHISEQWDAINLKWTRFVLNYDSESQASLLNRLMGAASPVHLAIWVVIIASSFGALLFALLILRMPKQKPVESVVLYRHLCKKIKGCNFISLPSETPRQFINRIIMARPDLAIELNNLINLFELWVYAENIDSLSQLRRAIAAFKPKPKPICKP